MKKLSVLAVLVNYGTEQLDYLTQVVQSLKSFEKYNVHVVVNSNVDLAIVGIDKVNVIEMEDYRLLPLTCRQIIWEDRSNFDLFFYSENDLLVREIHFDKFLEYLRVLPKNRIVGLLRFEKESELKYYPDYHADFDWNYGTVETYGGKVFAQFSNLHQASFILTQEQLSRIGERFDFTSLVEDKIPLTYKVKRKLRSLVGLKTKNYYIYDVLCKVCTDVYQYGGMKKIICISEFEDNLIHHMPNLYIHGDKGRKKLRSQQDRMDKALKKLLSK